MIEVRGSTLLVLGGVVAAGWAVAGASQARQAHDLQFKGEPVALGADAPRVGELIADIGFVDLAGESLSLSDLMGDRGLVVAVRDVLCPVSRRYGGRLARIEDEYRARGFGFLYLNVNAADTAEAARDEIEAYGFDAPYVLDPQAPLAHELAAHTSTEVFVLDAARTLRYRGAVDDQYGIGFTKPEPTATYLRDALDAMLGDAIPEVRGTIARRPPPSR